MPSSQTNPLRKIPRNHLKVRCGYSGEYRHKAADCPNKKRNQNKGQKGKNEPKKKHSPKGDSKRKGHKDMSKIKCYNFVESGHFACDCPISCDNTNIAQESEQNKEVENMLDLDNINVSEECAMMCTEVQYEDAVKDKVVYGDQGINTDEYEKAMYGGLTKTQSEEEEEVKYNVAFCANDSVSGKEKEVT